MKRQQFLAVLSAGITAIATAQTASAQTTVIYDSISSANGVARSFVGRSSPAGLPAGREFTGNAFNNVPTNLGTQITGLDFYVAATNNALTNYQSIRVNTQFWNDFGFGFAPDWFANAAGGVQTQDFTTAGVLPSTITPVVSGGATGDTFDVYLVSMTFAQPVVLTNDTLNSVVFNIQGNTGSGFFSTTDLTTFRTNGNGYVAGSSAIGPTGGYFLSQNGRTDFNFTNDENQSPPNDLQTPSTNVNQALGVRLYGAAVAVPEAGTIALLALGAGVPLAGVVLRRRRK